MSHCSGSFFYFKKPLGHPCMHACANDSNQGIRELVPPPKKGTPSVPFSMYGCTVHLIKIKRSIKQHQNKNQEAASVCLRVCPSALPSSFVLDAGSRYFFVMFCFSIFSIDIYALGVVVRVIQKMTKNRSTIDRNHLGFLFFQSRCCL